MIEARDGATIPVHTRGSGPAIVILHGGGVDISVYRWIAAAFEDRFTIHLYNRRGRADAPARTRPYDMREDIDDLAAVLDRTGAVNVIGHSGGGFIALEAARELPIERLALYDAAVHVDNQFPTAWLEGARAALEAGDTARAIALVGRGINTHQPASRLPLGVQTAICRAFLRTPIGKMMGELLHLTFEESNSIFEHAGPASKWSGITAKVLLACGAGGPGYYPKINEALASVLPDARTLLVPKSAHDALNRAHPRIVEPLVEFFS
ncbi:alpha/beta fold hydrolase [Actinoplanes couchii]|uniref:Alpha/beta hydrolase n=1 Tax=Actinoplanes couchii TaxID=403638 RepID=A0ABQ3X748_9ACTN|nr:alpha/beta fold hydrolase [Actinoplanes couchii]MDR6322166.1 pimeloyl-ACP methyl ester carboxylesterase [Actinoplanes couchii]GID54331.1 alpha/beta hydrolase [Actinoplanes couchii]